MCYSSLESVETYIVPTPLDDNVFYVNTPRCIVFFIPSADLFLVHNGERQCSYQLAC